MAKQLKPPAMPKRTASPEDLWEELQHAVRAVGGSLAGYLSLARNLQPAEGRAPSIPMLNFKGSVDGVRVEDVVLDLNSQLGTEQSTTVLVSLCQMLHTQLLEAIARANGATLELHKLFAQPVVKTRKPEDALIEATQPPSAPAAEEEEDSFDYETDEPEEAPPAPAPQRRVARPRHGN